MGQKVNPIGLRTGVNKDWNSKWYAESKDFSEYLVEDHKIRKYVKNKLNYNLLKEGVYEIRWTIPDLYRI